MEDRARLIFNVKYLKPQKNNEKKLSNLINYVATRENVVYNEDTFYEKMKTTKATEKQKQYIDNYIYGKDEKYKEFADFNKETIEYQNYIKNPTMYNASQLISYIADKIYSYNIPKETLIEYISNRPKVVIKENQLHGLFGNFDTTDLNKVKDEIKSIDKNIYTGVISLRREDAQKYNFENVKSWQNLINRNVEELARATNISLNDFKWCGAFHNESHHPHIHLIFYSTNLDEKANERLNSRGILKFKSKLVNDIFESELMPLMKEKSDLRDKLKIKIKDLDFYHNDFSNDLENKIILLRKKLLELKKGNTKKQNYTKYGFLPKDERKLVDEILKDIAENKDIQEIYSLWSDIYKKQIGMYQVKDFDVPPIEENNNFRYLKNLIISKALYTENQRVFEKEQIQKSIFDIAFSISNFIGQQADIDLENEEQNLIDKNAYKKQIVRKRKLGIKR